MSDREVIRHKRGDTIAWPFTYSVDGEPVDLTPYSIKSEVRKEIGRELVGELVIVKDPDQVNATGQGTLTATAEDVALWPVQTLIVDIQYTLAGVVASSETFAIQIESDVTE
jgi:hypothetical protein